MNFRSIAAKYGPDILGHLQALGLMPDPNKNTSIRRLQQDPENDSYTRQICGEYSPAQTLLPPELRPDTLAGDTYAAYIKACGESYQHKWTFGIFDVSSVRVLPKFGVHWAAAGNFIEVYFGAETLRNPKYEIPRLALPVLPLAGQHDTGIFLAPANYHNFYHWMVDFLPRLEIVSRHLSDGIPIIVPSSLGEFARSTLGSSLAWLGIQNVSVVELSGGAHHFDRLVMPTNLTPSLDVSPRQRDFLRGVFLNTKMNFANKKRIYISRKDAVSRRISNEAEIEEILLAYGFDVVTMSGMPISQQVTLFASAEIVVSPHGAALTNIAFCEPGTVVIEIFQEGHFAPCYARLAQLGNLTYGFGVGPSKGGSTYLDPTQIRKLFKSIGL